MSGDCSGADPGGGGGEPSPVPCARFQYKLH